MSASMTPQAEAAFQLTIRVRMAARAVLRAAESCAGQKGVTHPEVTLLACLNDFGPSTVPQVARIRSMTRQSIQSTVDGLAARGLVELFPNPDHQRSRLVRPTPAGDAVREAVEQLAAASLREVAQGLRVPDLKAATKVLEALVARLCEVHPPA